MDLRYKAGKAVALEGAATEVWIKVMREHVFRPEVELPPRGLQLNSERIRCAHVIAALYVHFPLEIVLQILALVILDTPAMGMNPVLFFRWFWKQDTKTFPRVPRGAGFDSRVQYAQHRGYRTDFWMEHSLGCWPPFLSPGGRRVDMETLERILTWRDLRGVIINCLTGSSAAHALWGGVGKDEIGGTSRWYPGDWDVFVATTQCVIIFEVWLEKVFRDVRSLCATEEAPKARSPRGGLPDVESWKWKIGSLVINAARSSSSLIHAFDNTMVQTSCAPPFDLVTTTMLPPGDDRQDGLFHRIYLCPHREFLHRAMAEVKAHPALGRPVALAKKYEDRHKSRVEVYKRRYPTAELVIPRIPENHMFLQ